MPDTGRGKLRLIISSMDGAAAAGAAPAPAPAAAMHAAVPAAMLLVAAAEAAGDALMPAAAAGALSRACLRPARATRAALLPAHDTHPCLASAGAWAVPRLLPERIARERTLAEPAACSSNRAIITGGTGALGSLLGAWLVESMAPMPRRSPGAGRRGVHAPPRTRACSGGNAARVAVLGRTGRAPQPIMHVLLADQVRACVCGMWHLCGSLAVPGGARVRRAQRAQARVRKPMPRARAGTCRILRADVM